MTIPVPPHLPAVIPAAVLYFTAGLAYLTLSGTALPERMRPVLGDTRAAARIAALAAALALALLLWPAAPLLRAAGSGPLKRALTELLSRAREAMEHLSGRAEAGDRTPQLPASGPPAHEPEAFDDFASELDFAGAADRLRAACEEQRLVDAVFIASALVDDVTHRLGPEHPQVLDAMEALAHVAHLVGDEGRSVRLYVHVANRRAWHYGIDHPGARAALRNAYASWLSASDQVALMTGHLLLPCLRMIAGSTAPITTSSEHRLHCLRATMLLVDAQR
jgi:hypothetical protein